MQLGPEPNAAWHTVVGVAAPSLMEGSLREGERGEPVIYQTLRQSVTAAQLSLLLGASNTGFDYLGAIRNAAAAADRDTLITDIQSVSAMEQDRADAQGFNRNMVYAVLLIAIYLTAVATYGLAARAVARRRMETGIRMALGASPDACIRLFLRDGCKMVIYGLGIGSMLAIAASYSLLASNGSATAAIRALIPTLALLGFVMGTLVLLANYFPARRLVAMEPTDALRYE
jgi:ABC-type antimicrobial peptide transport system permease subunit